MTEKDRLMHALFGHAERREHINIKFFRGTSSDVTAEQMCEQAANAIEEIVTGLVDPSHPRDTVDDGYRQRERAEIIAAL